MQSIKFDELQHKGIAEILFIKACLAVIGGDVAPTDDGVYDIEFKIQGMEVDFYKFCAAIVIGYDSAVARGVADKLEEITESRELRGKLDEIRAAAMSKCQALLEEFNKGKA